MAFEYKMTLSFAGTVMEVGGVGGGELGSSTVVVSSDGELQYELNQQTNSFLANTHIVQQGEVIRR